MVRHIVFTRKRSRSELQRRHCREGQLRTLNMDCKTYMKNNQKKIEQVIEVKPLIYEGLNILILKVTVLF